METQELVNYQRIAKAISYIKQNFKDQPSLERVAEEVNVSPFHFQRLFTDWAGVSPKKFIQYLSLNYAKELLREKQINLLEVADETGLSGTGRLHDLFVTIEGMTPGEFRNGGEDLQINYGFSSTPFGEVIIASTSKGICYLAFTEDGKKTLADLIDHFPKAQFFERSDEHQQGAIQILAQPGKDVRKIKMHLKGTYFQLKVWEALLKIPLGEVSTYGALSARIGSPKAARAVGSAIGDNPVAFIIPCHRVIRSSGEYGEYRWGSTRKSLLIGWEAAKIDPDHQP